MNVRIYLAISAPVFAREILPPGFALDGRVIVEEKASMAVFEPGWPMSVAGAGNFMLQRSEFQVGVKS